MNADKKVWLITGSSSGFGRALAEAVLQHGDYLVATARKPEQLNDLVEQYPETVKAVRLDVTEPQSIQDALKSAIDTFDRIDVLVNNAGYGLLGGIEEVSNTELRNQFETNFFGALNVIQAILPQLRQQRSGHILNVSSVGGFRGFPGFGIYNGTKFALEGISEALALEVAPLGIKVTIVEPGSFRTDWAGRSMVRAENKIDDYAETSGETRSWIDEENGIQAGDPAKAASAMIKAVYSENPPQRLVLGADALELIRQKIDSVTQELDKWEQTTVDTAYADSVAAS